MVVNSTSLYNNLTQTSIFTAKTSEIMRIVFLVITFFCFFLFLYFTTVLLIVYFTTPHVRDNARYILFAHMLFNDTLYLILTLFLSLAFQNNLYIQVPTCYFILTLAVTTFMVTPYNLAAMAFERYIAICFPFRHAILCTAQHTYSVIIIIWVVGLLPNVVDFIIFSCSVEKDFYSRYFLCKQDKLVVRPVQSTIRSFTFIASLFFVAVVMLFTYIKVMLVARKSGSGKSSASKASKTLMLHTFQLILCTLSITSSVTESFSGDYYVILTRANFLFFMCFPRLLSTLIYGLRDKVFSKYIKKIKLSLNPQVPLQCCP